METGDQTRAKKLAEEINVYDLVQTLGRELPEIDNP
jgi:hypothetical protein